MSATHTTAKARLRVGELADRTGLSTDTVRYYERVGLLPPATRTPNGYRAYGEAAVDRLQFIKGAQRLGLTLTDIGDLLAIRDTGVCPCEPAEQLLRRRLAELDEQMARLATLREQVVAMISGLPTADCPPPSPGTWVPAHRGEVNTMANDDDCCTDDTCCPSGCC